MKVINPRYEIISPSPLKGKEILQQIEMAGRTCYKSEEKITNDSCIQFAKNLIKRKHMPMIEFGASITVKFICNRGFTHELVRHRLTSLAQESTRYCNYSKDKHDNQITVIKPRDFDKWDSSSRNHWIKAMKEAERHYILMLDRKRSPQEARGVLPIDIKTEINIKANIREWRHIFIMRTADAAHPSMQQLMRPLLDEFKQKIPVLFDDIAY